MIARISDTASGGCQHERERRKSERDHIQQPAPPSAAKPSSQRRLPSSERNDATGLRKDSGGTWGAALCSRTQTGPRPSDHLRDPVPVEQLLVDLGTFANTGRDDSGCLACDTHVALELVQNFT